MGAIGVSGIARAFDTRTAKDIAKVREIYMKDYIAELMAEWEGSR